ncbi:MAG TPA: hypothetical protein VK020_09370, partial [Microlunatus sp.]|nr:hypothetical protein [Microlunatus sp.]
AGAAAGAAALLGLIDGPTLGRVHRADLPAEVLGALPNDGVADEEYVQRELGAAAELLDSLVPSTGVEADAVRLHQVLNQLRIFGEAFLLTADPGYAEVYRALLLGYVGFVLDHPAEATDQLNNNRNMWTNGEELIAVWSVVEVDGLFSEAERAEVLETLRITFAANAQDPYLLRARPEAPRWNHEAYPALSLVAGADYFLRHTELTAATEWLARGEMIFTGNTAVISLDEGADYLMHLPMITMDYGMFTGRLDYLNRTVRPSADLNLLMIDNVGSMVGGGDVYPFGYSGVYSWGHSQVMHAAAWLYGDPRYTVLLERARTGPFAGARMPDLDFPLHRYLVLGDEQSGEATAPPAVMAYPIEPGVYDDVTAETPTTIPRERTFHKLTFRAGLAIDRPTLMLDGFAGGTHNHQDGNAIIGYTALQRLFLTDRDYMENTPEHHTGLVVVRDGVQQPKGVFTRIDWVAEVPGGSFSRTVVGDWNGTDWTRTVITPDGGFHLVLDDLAVRTAGDYLIKNQWQSLGLGELSGHRYRCRQQDATMIIDSLDDSQLRTADRYGHFRKYFRSTYPYPFAEGETVLSQIHPEQHRNDGDQLHYVNVVAAGAGDGPELSTRRWTDRLCQIGTAAGDWWLLRDPVRTAELTSDGTVHLLGPDRMISAGATTVTLAGTEHRFDEEVLLTVDLSTGSWAAFPVRRDLVHYDEHGEPIRPGPVAEGSSALRRRHVRGVIAELRPGGETDDPADKVTPPPRALPQGWTRLTDLETEVTHTHRPGPDTSGPALVIGTADGRVIALDPTGETLWTSAVTGRVNEITSHVVPNGAGSGDRTMITVATEGWHVHALGPDGAELWRREIPNESARREVKGNLIGVTTVRLGHVDGRDSDPWLMVGTQFRWVYGLDLAGTIRHEVMLYYYGIEDAVFADLDGDGKDEGGFALEYFYPVVWDDGKEVRGPRPEEGPGFTTVELLPDGDNAPALVFGTKQNDVRSYRFRDGRIEPEWIRNVGGQVTVLTQGSFHDPVGPELLVGTTGFHALSLGLDGAPRFRATIGDTVRELLPLPGTGYLVAADHGLLVDLDPAGAERTRWRFPAAVAGLAAPAGDGPWVVLADGRVLRRG